MLAFDCRRKRRTLGGLIMGGEKGIRTLDTNVTVGKGNSGDQGTYPLFSPRTHLSCPSCKSCPFETVHLIGERT
jgi:hypothetical protein